MLLFCTKYPDLVDGSPSNCRDVRLAAIDSPNQSRSHNVCGIMGMGWEEKEQTEHIPGYPPNLTVTATFNPNWEIGRVKSGSNVFVADNILKGCK
jgi:hypothetical protein